MQPHGRGTARDGGGRLRAALAAAGFALTVFLLTAAFAVAIGIAWRDAVRIAFMVLLAVVTAAALHEAFPRWRRIVLGLTAAWLIAWALQLGLHFILLWRHGVAPNAAMVLESIANTTSNESSQYLVQAMALNVAAVAAVAVLGLAHWALTRKMLAATGRLRLSSATKAGFLGLACAGLFAWHAEAERRNENPPFYWSGMFDSYRAWQQTYQQLIAQRARGQAQVADWRVTHGGKGCHTLALALGESVNRENLSIYGYARETTPELAAMREQLYVFSDVVSSAGYTMAEITRMLSLATTGDDASWRDQPTVLMLARAAGYKTIWLSNQNDRYVNTIFASASDVFRQANRGGHHGNSGLDENLLPLFDTALADPACHKLIVLHMLGGHPDYAKRYPDEFARFTGANDAVAAEMARQGRWEWVREARNHYDNAMRYQDFVLASLIRRMNAPAPERRTFLFVADHGQEVGHFSNSVGHSAKLESGFTVPAILWTNEPPRFAVPKAELERRPYQTDKLDWTLLALLDVKTRFDRPDYDLLGSAFRPFPRYINGLPYAPDVMAQTTAGMAVVRGQERGR